MAQSFSLANMIPQVPEHNRGASAKSVEGVTRKYAARASGDVYVITVSAYEPSIAQIPSIGPGKVRIPKYLLTRVRPRYQSGMDTLATSMMMLREAQSRSAMTNWSGVPGSTLYRA